MTSSVALNLDNVHFIFYCTFLYKKGLLWMGDAFGQAMKLNTQQTSLDSVYTTVIVFYIFFPWEISPHNLIYS